MKRFLIALVVIGLACHGGEKPITTSTAPAKPKSPPPPSAAAAKDIIANSSDFSEYQFTNAAYTLPMKKSAMNEPALKAAQELASAKWIRFSGDAVLLMEKASSDRRFLVRPNGYVDLVPIAKKDFAVVTSVRPNRDGTVSAEFEWRWIPNDVGQSFRSGLVKERFATTQHATAKLMWDGKAWTVLRIDEVK
jgi:hypothetical protein